MVESLEPVQTWRERIESPPTQDQIDQWNAYGSNPPSAEAVWSLPNPGGARAVTPTEMSSGRGVDPSSVFGPGGSYEWDTSGTWTDDAVKAGQAAYQQYLDEQTNQWRLQKEAIDAQYAPSLARQADDIANMQGRYAGSMDAYGDFEKGMSALDTEIPYGAISELDTSRVTRQFDEAEGRLAEALNLARDDFSDQMVGEIRYFEDVTKTMLADDIENTEQLHELSSIYSQAIADEAYAGQSLEAERAKLELKAQFDRSIYDAQRELARTKSEQADALRRANDQFQMEYPDFDANRDAITKSAFSDWAKQSGMSEEDTLQSWLAYEAIYNDPDWANKLLTQSDFDSAQRSTINYGTLQYLDMAVWGELEYLWANQLDPADPNYATNLIAQNSAMKVYDWLDRNDLADLFETGTQKDQQRFMHMLIAAGIETDAAVNVIAKGKDASREGALLSYHSPESEAARQAFRMTNDIDDNWEDIYYQSMTIPVDSQYIQTSPNGAVFPVAGPDVAFDQIGNVASQQGTPIVSALPGTVVESDYNGEDGYYIIVDHGGGKRTKYSHLQQASHFEKGATVSAGTSIGRIGNTGSASTSAYALYFEYLIDGVATDPSKLFEGSA